VAFHESLVEALERSRVREAQQKLQAEYDFFLHGGDPFEVRRIERLLGVTFE